MRSWTGAGRALPVWLLAMLAASGAEPAFADATFFAGSAASPGRATLGAALGLALEPVGVEFEYGGAPADPAAGTAALRTGLFNLLVGAPARGGRRVQVYASVGVGAYRERLEEHARTGLAASAGGGVHVRLAGPFRLRFDYRVFALRGSALRSRPRRAYAGLGVAF